jgi:hypothetical protein
MNRNGDCDVHLPAQRAQPLALSRGRRIVNPSRTGDFPHIAPVRIRGQTIYLRLMRDPRGLNSADGDLAVRGDEDLRLWDGFQVRGDVAVREEPYPLVG